MARCDPKADKPIMFSFLLLLCSHAASRKSRNFQFFLSRVAVSELLGLFNWTTYVGVEVIFEPVIVCFRYLGSLFCWAYNPEILKSLFLLKTCTKISKMIFSCVNQNC